MGKSSIVFALSFALVAVAVAQNEPDRKRMVEHQLGADHFVAGGSVKVRQPVSGDLLAAGGSIDVDANVNGDALVTGGRLRISGDVGQSVYAAAGHLDIDGKVGRNVRVAGGEVEIGPKAQVIGNVTIAGGEVSVRGSVGGYVQAGAGRVLIDGPVAGDVVVGSGHVELGPNARVGGKLLYRSREELKQDPAAKVAGGIEHVLPRGGAPGAEPKQYRFARGVRWVWTAGMMLLAVALLAAFPAFFGRVGTTLQSRPGMSLLLGFVLLVCVPVGALVLLITIIGIPLGLLAMLLYLALMPVAYASTGIGLGDWVLRKYKSDQAARLGWRLGAAALAVLLIAALRLVPWFGGLIGFAALLVGLGALLLQFKRVS